VDSNRRVCKVNLSINSRMVKYWVTNKCNNSILVNRELLDVHNLMLYTCYFGDFELGNIIIYYRFGIMGK
jgi:hypothetical protein